MLLYLIAVVYILSWNSYFLLPPRVDANKPSWATEAARFTHIPATDMYRILFLFDIFSSEF
jgi:hypothetical protein